MTIKRNDTTTAYPMKNTQLEMFEPTIANGKTPVKVFNVCLAVDQTSPYQVRVNGVLIGEGSEVVVNVPITIREGKLIAARVDLENNTHVMGPRP